MNNMLLEQAIIEYRIKHILKTPHLKAKYLAEYKRETGSNILDEGFKDWLKSTWSSTKHAASKLGSLEQGGKIFGRGKEKKIGKERYDLASSEISKNEITAPFWQAFTEKYKEFPNMKSQEEFYQSLEEFGKMYDSVVAAVENKKLNSKKANAAIYSMRTILKVTLDYNLADIYKHFNESIDLSQIEIITEEEERKRGEFTKKSKAQVEDDTDHASDTATVQGLKSNTLPATLAALGALGAGFGWLIKQPWFLAMLKNPDTIGDVRKLIKAKGGITQQLAILNGNPTADYSNMKVADFLAQMKSHGLIDAANKPTQNLLNIAKEAGNGKFGNWWNTNLLNASPNATLSQAIPLSGSGAPGAGGDVITDKVLGSITRTVAQTGAAKAGAVAAAKVAGPALMAMGIPLIAGGLAIKALRMKGLESSRSQLLSTLLNQIKDVKQDGGNEEGEGGGEGTQPPQGPEGKGQGEVVYVYKQGGEDNNSLTRILTGLDLPSWAVKDLTSRVKKELEANNFIVKEDRFDYKVGQGAVKRKENPVDKLMSYKDIIGNIESQLKNRKYEGSVRDFIEKIFNDKRIKDMFSLNEASRKNERQSLFNQIAEVISELTGFTVNKTIRDLASKVHDLFTTYKADLNTGKKEGQGGVAVDDPKTNEENPFTQPPVEPPKGPENEGITDEEIKDLVQRSKESFIKWKSQYNNLVSKYSNLVAGGEEGASAKLIDFINEADVEFDKVTDEKSLDAVKAYYRSKAMYISGLSNTKQKKDQVRQTYLDAIQNIKFKEKDTVQPPIKPPQGPETTQKPEALKPTAVKIDSDFLRSVMEFASDTTVENDKGKEIKFTRKQIFDNPKEFLNALSADEKRLYLRLSEDPNKEPSKVDFFKMSSDERKQMYMKMKRKQSMFDYGNTEKADTKELKKKIQNLYNLIQSPNTPENKKKQAKEELPKLQKDLKDAEQRGTGREFKSPTSTPYTGPDQKEIEKKIKSLNSVIKNPNMSDEQKQKAKQELPKLQKQLEKAKREIEATSGGVFNISDLRNILRTGHSKERGPDEKEQRRPIPDEKIRAAQKAISSYLSPYLKKAGVALRESQLDNVAIGFINEINNRFDNALFESKMNRWKVLANIK